MCTCVCVFEVVSFVWGIFQRKRIPKKKISKSIRRRRKNRGLLKHYFFAVMRLRIKANLIRFAMTDVSFSYLKESILPTFYERIFCTNFWRQAKCYKRKRRSYEKFVLLMLMKLTVGVNFANVLRAAFTLADPESAKKTDNLIVFLRNWDLHEISSRSYKTCFLC